MEALKKAIVASADPTSPEFKNPPGVEAIYKAIIDEVKWRHNWTNAWQLFDGFLCPLILATTPSTETASAVEPQDEEEEKGEEEEEETGVGKEAQTTTAASNSSSSSSSEERPRLKLNRELTAQETQFVQWAISALVRYAPNPQEANRVYMFFLQQCRPPLRDDKTINHCLVSLIYQYAQVKGNNPLMAQGLELIQVALDRGVGLPTYEATPSVSQQRRRMMYEKQRQNNRPFAPPQKDSILASVSRPILRYHRLRISEDGRSLVELPPPRPSPQNQGAYRQQHYQQQHQPPQPQHQQQQQQQQQPPHHQSTNPQASPATPIFVLPKPKKRVERNRFQPAVPAPAAAAAAASSPSPSLAAPTAADTAASSINYRGSRPSQRPSPPTPAAAVVSSHPHHYVYEEETGESKKSKKKKKNRNKKKAHLVYSAEELQRQEEKEEGQGQEEEEEEDGEEDIESGKEPTMEELASSSGPRAGIGMGRSSGTSGRHKAAASGSLSQFKQIRFVTASTPPSTATTTTLTTTTTTTTTTLAPLQDEMVAAALNDADENTTGDKTVAEQTNRSETTPQGDVKAKSQGNIEAAPQGDDKATPQGDVKATPQGDAKATPQGDDEGLSTQLKTMEISDRHVQETQASSS